MVKIFTKRFLQRHVFIPYCDIFYFSFFRSRKPTRRGRQPSSIDFDLGSERAESFCNKFSFFELRKPSRRGRQPSSIDFDLGSEHAESYCNIFYFSFFRSRKPTRRGRQPSSIDFDLGSERAESPSLFKPSVLFSAVKKYFFLSIHFFFIFMPPVLKKN